MPPTPTSILAGGLALLGLAQPVPGQEAEASQPAIGLPPLVTPEIERAVQRGLQFLNRTQNRDGSWRTRGGQGSYPTAMTALAGLALATSGSTPTRGRHYLQVRRAAGFLLRQSGPEGLLAVPSEERSTMHGHGFATLFLAQVYGMEEDQRQQERIEAVLRSAVELTTRSQSAAGGWLYTPDDRGDEGSVTVTQIQALRACRNAGLAVSDEVVESAVAYIRRSSNPDGSIRYSVQATGGGRPAITAAAVAVLYNAGRYDDPLAERALAFAQRTLPINGSGNPFHYYAQLYLAQALYQRGGEDWEGYYEKMAQWLLGQQRRDGSWQGDQGYTTYGTAIALIILQLPYAHLPIFQR